LCLIGVNNCCCCVDLIQGAKVLLILDIIGFAINIIFGIAAFDFIRLLIFIGLLIFAIRALITMKRGEHGTLKCYVYVKIILIIFITIFLIVASIFIYSNRDEWGNKD